MCGRFSPIPPPYKTPRLIFLPTHISRCVSIFTQTRRHVHYCQPSKQFSTPQTHSDVAKLTEASHLDASKITNPQTPPTGIHPPWLHVSMNPERETESVRESAPYGKACLGCSRAKCKCILHGRGTTCERCHRLNKVCQPSPVVRKRVSRRTGNGRTRHLEEKLDSLVSLLSKQSSGTDEHRQEDAESTPDSSRTQDEIPLRPAPVSDPYAVPPIHMPSLAQASSNHTPSSTEPLSLDLDVPPALAEEYLRQFREQHLKFFPFINISPETRYALIHF